MQIRKRLKAIASLVPKGAKVIDIGCDHALLDVYLTLYNQNKCIASDVNKNAYEIAKSNIKKYNLEDEILTVNCSGFDKIEMSGLYTAVICGMGTTTILSILNSEKLKYVDTLILQSNNDLYHLRKEIVKKGFLINEEYVVIERDIFYVLIRCKRGHKHYSLIDLWLGPVIRKRKNSLDIDYLSHVMNTYGIILQKLPNKYLIKKLLLKIKIMLLKKEL